MAGAGAAGAPAFCLSSVGFTPSMTDAWKWSWRTTLDLRSPRDGADEPTAGHLAPRSDRAIHLAARGLVE